uniref:ARAD1D38368p n=1 Tax=Blastobotrys adeninivorans TaxID=409370 RepID=A0A060TBY7_BLAAD
MSNIFGLDSGAIDPQRDIVLITGGGGGLGASLASLLNQKGYRVVVLDVSIPPNSKRIHTVAYYKCDVSKKNQVDSIAATIENKIGPISVLINNAAINCPGPVITLNQKALERTLQVNVVANVHTIQAFVPGMITRGRGYIVTIASVLGHISPANLSAYGASKSALIALHESLTQEMANDGHSGVRTLLVSPGQMNTTLFSAVSTPSRILAPVLTPEYVAGRIVGSLESGSRGELHLPMYGYFVPLVRAMPYPLAAVVRYLTGVDRTAIAAFHQ